MICGFTGHRPEKLPWGRDETDPRCTALKQLLRQRVSTLADRGVETFCCGMARGCDLYFAEAVLEQMQVRPGLKLEAWIPCPSQADRWPEQDRLRRSRILSRCTRIRVLEPEYSRGCMLRRNKALTDYSDMLLTVWDGSSGGTGWTVAYAKRQGKRLWELWL